MGRPEKPIPDSASKELRALARHLRDLRDAAGLSYREIGAHPDGGGYSAGTFQRAASGERIPSKEVAEAFAGVCGGDVRKALKLRLEAARADAWRSVRHAYTTALREGRDAGAPPPRHISPSEVASLRDLRCAMRYIHLQAGRPSSRELERADLTGHLSHTTLDRVLNTRTRPRLPTPELLDAFLASCDVPERNRKAWKSAHARLADAARRARLTSHRLRTPSDPEDAYWFFRRLKPGHRHDVDPRGFGRSYDAVEEYTDQWAIEYADNKNMEESFD